MKKYETRIILITAVLFVLAGCFVSFAFLGPRIISELRDTADGTNDDCIQEFGVSEMSDYSMYSVIYEIEESDQQRETISAYDPDILSVIVFPLDIKGNLEIDDEAFLYSGVSDGSVFLNGKYFSDIERISVHRGDGKEKLGTYKGYDTEEIEYSDVFRFLLESEILSSYDHLQSEICLEGIDDGDDEYVAHYSGVHEYCTNDCYEESFKFDMILDKSNGNIWVER